MATGSDKSLPPSLSPSHLEKSDIEKLLQSGLADFSLRELLGAMLSNLAQAERGAYLQNQTEDKANGFYPRSLLVGSVPVEIEVPRTRSGQFRPPSLPARYQRGFSEETQSLLLGLLSASRSVSAAREALRKMGLSSSEHELEQIASSFIDELELRNSRPLDPDLLALFCDGKYVEIRDGDRLKPACIYLVVGLTRDGKKRVLACLAKSGRENLEDWKLVLRSLIERGLRRILIVVHDDFSGLLPITKSLFPGADIQLCAVHMQRNAKNQPSRPEDLHPEPLTDSGHKPLDLSGSCHPLKAAAFHRDRRVPPVSPLTLLIATRVTCSLRSSGITPFPRYYGAVRPWVTHRYFRTRGSSTCAFSLSIASQVLKFRTKARTRFTPPLHRTPHSQ